MLADLVHDHDLLWSGAITGLLAFIGVLTTLILGTRKLNSNREAAREIAQEVLDYLDTGNGHTMGMAVSRLEEQFSELSNRLDRTEILEVEAHARTDELVTDMADKVTAVTEKLDQHLNDVQPLVEWTSEQMEAEDG